jgi:hypothetical protein
MEYSVQPWAFGNAFDFVIVVGLKGPACAAPQRQKLFRRREIYFTSALARAIILINHEGYLPLWLCAGRQASTELRLTRPRAGSIYISASSIAPQDLTAKRYSHATAQCWLLLCISLLLA